MGLFLHLLRRYVPWFGEVLRKPCVLDPEGIPDQGDAPRLHHDLLHRSYLHHLPTLYAYMQPGQWAGNPGAEPIYAQVPAVTP